MRVERVSHETKSWGRETNPDGTRRYRLDAVLSGSFEEVERFRAQEGRDLAMVGKRGVLGDGPKREDLEVAADLCDAQGLSIVGEWLRDMARRK